MRVAIGIPATGAADILMAMNGAMDIATAMVVGLKGAGKNRIESKIFATASGLFDRKKRVSVHLLGIIVKNLNRITDLSDRDKDIESHRLGSRP